jgi:arginase
MKKIKLLAAPSNLGLKEPSPGIEPGVKHLPKALLRTGFAASLDLMDIETIIPPLYSTEVDPVSGVRNADKIAAYSRTLASAIEELNNKDVIPIVIGGDCSILIGTSLGLKRTGNYGLFFMDGHTDYYLPEHSSGAAAGLDLALVTGKGHKKLTNIQDLGPYIAEDNVFAYGNRDFDPVYVKLIQSSGINYFDLNEVRTQGIAEITTQFLLHVKKNDLDGFWIHLDVDVLDDAIMPCVDSRANGGLSYDELSETVIPLLQSPFFKGMDITILDPTMDGRKEVINEFGKRMTKILESLLKLSSKS